MPTDEAEKRLFTKLTHAAAFCELSYKLDVQTVGKRGKKNKRGIFSSCSLSFPVRGMPHLLMSEQCCKQGFLFSATPSPLDSILTHCDWVCVWVIPGGTHNKKKMKVYGVSLIFGVVSMRQLHTLFIIDHFDLWVSWSNICLGRSRLSEWRCKYNIYETHLQLWF